MKPIVTRSLSGIVYIAVIVAGLLCGETVFKCFMALFMTLGLVEFYGLTNGRREHTVTLLADIAGGLIAIFGLYDFAADLALDRLWGLLYLVYFLLRLIMQLYTREQRPLDTLAFSFLGQLYIVLPIGLMSFIYTAPGLGGLFLLAMFVMIWLNDTGAYCVGSLIGRHKLFPRISPKKSWEGFVGGVVFAIASAFVFCCLLPKWYYALTLPQMLGMGAVVAVFSTWGDLVESLMKRSLGVKDSGNLIPGHGGILDRIDSLLLVVPALTVYLLLLR